MKELIYLGHKIKYAGLLFSFLLLFNITAKAQVRFPYPVYNGDSLNFTIKKNKLYKLDTRKDTFWIMKNSQYQNALIFAKKYKVCEEQIVEYKNEVNLLKETQKEHDALVKTLEEDRDFYKKNWTESEKDIEQFNKKCKRQKIITRITMIGIPAAFVLGLLI